MKLIITWLRKDGRCRSLTNASPEEHACMSLTVWYDAMERLGEKWEVSPHDASEKINQMLREVPIRKERD